jgi:hypothetical protein
MARDKKHVFSWFTLDMLVFAALNFYLLYNYSDQLDTLWQINIFTLLILGLATFRTAHIISNEVVTKPLRAPFVDEKLEHGKVVEEPKKRGFLRAVGLLIYCPSCTGVWIATVFAYCYAFWPSQTFLIALLLALSGIERIISKLLTHH